MPINPACLAYASNNNGKGDLNCLAHTLIAHIRAKRLTPDALAFLRGAYNVFYSSKRGFKSLDEVDFLRKINQFTPVQVEKEITPVLESLMKDSRKPHFNKFVELANSFGLKVEIYSPGYEDKEEEPTILDKNGDFRPSKNLKLVELTELAKEASDDLVDFGRLYQDVDQLQSKLDGIDNPPKVKLLLTDGGNGSCNCYFEYPGADAEEDEDYDGDDQERLRRINIHNEAIWQKNERVKKALKDGDEPLSFTESVSTLVQGIGIFLAKMFDMLMVFCNKFQGKFGNFGSSGNQGQQQSSDQPASAAAPATGSAPGASTPSSSQRRSSGTPSIPSGASFLPGYSQLRRPVDFLGSSVSPPRGKNGRYYSF